MNLIPMIVDKEINGERSYDIFSKLLKNRIIIYSGRIANALLDKGYQIVQVRPDKRNKIKSVFVFRADDGIEDELYKMINL